MNTPLSPRTHPLPMGVIQAERPALRLTPRDPYTPRDAPPCEIDEAREFRLVKVQLDLMAW